MRASEARIGTPARGRMTAPYGGRRAVWLTGEWTLGYHTFTRNMLTECSETNTTVDEDELRWGPSKSEFECTLQILPASPQNFISKHEMQF